MALFMHYNKTNRAGGSVEKSSFHMDLSTKRLGIPAIDQPKGFYVSITVGRESLQYDYISGESRLFRLK